MKSLILFVGNCGVGWGGCRTHSNFWGVSVSINLRTLGLRTSIYTRRWLPTARVPSVARGTIFNGALSVLKYSNYDIMKNLIFK